MERNREHIHTPDDKRGRRDVYVNGKLVQKCFFADTVRGIADCYVEPLRADKHNKRLMTKRHRGLVVVKPQGALN